ncbi:MAG: HlyD family type I secretion periplasmic adaptor subunit [Rubrivivax sp.]|nr:HlyD family type I secretion periplasmic adaptor subunit [Rubrivivax sp.]
MKNVTDVEAVDLQTDTRAPARLGFWVLIVGFGLFLAWAAWAPLDEGVTAPATVSVEMRRKTIQHLQGGVIKDVPVGEGQHVKRGDTLVVLDDATVRATFEAIRQNYLSQRAMEGRLLAEATGKSGIGFHPDLLRTDDPVAQQLMAVQRQVLASRQAALRAEMDAGQQSISGYENQSAGLQRMLTSRRQQAEIQSRQLGNVQALSAEGYAPRNQALQLEQQQAELMAALTDLEKNIQGAKSAALEVRLRMTQRQQEYLREVSSQLAEVRREVQANQERLAAITAELGRMVITSPVDGQVVGLALAQAGGGVVTPGQKLMDIVPEGESLLLDAKVPPHVIDRIRVGENAEVRFSSFADSPTLVVHGRLVSLAGDALTEQMGAAVMTYYLARVELTPEGVKALGGRNLQPGMPAEVLIKTGERSLLTYMLHPLLKRVAAAMTEE